jgi:hypothetical protein
MSSAALDGWEDEPPVTPAKRRRAAALVPSVEKIRRSSAPRRLPAPVLLLDDEFQEHLRLHRSPRCSKCAFAMNRAAWEAVASLPRGRTWLQPQPVNAADWWVSCSVCDAAGSLATRDAARRCGCTARRSTSATSGSMPSRKRTPARVQQV